MTQLNKMVTCGLVTIQHQERTKSIFDFHSEVYSSGVTTIEVLMFNCPEWGISAEAISVEGALSYPFAKADTDFEFFLVLKTISTTTLTSCDSIVTVCIYVDSSLPILALTFSLPPGSHRVHLAEVRFSSSSSNVGQTSHVAQNGVS